MRKTLKYFSSVFIFLVVSGCLTAQVKRVKGLRIGFDISKPTMMLFDPDRTGFEFSGDIEVIKNLYSTLEMGWLNITREKENFNYSSTGNYYRFGFDYNIMKLKASDEYEMIYVGLRYGYSRLSHEADQIVLINDYWDGSFLSVGEDNLNASWIDLVFGMRAEVFRNFFIGWSVRVRPLLNQVNDDVMKPFIIPGYGKGEKPVVVGFHYTLYYRIPLFKSTVVVKPDKKKNSTKKNR